MICLVSEAGRSDSFWRIRVKVTAAIRCLTSFHVCEWGVRLAFGLKGQKSCTFNLWQLRRQKYKGPNLCTFDFWMCWPSRYKGRNLNCFSQEELKGKDTGGEDDSCTFSRGQSWASWSRQSRRRPRGRRRLLYF